MKKYKRSQYVNLVLSIIAVVICYEITNYSVTNNHLVLAFIAMGGYFGLLVRIGYVTGDTEGAGKVLQLHEIEDGRYVVLDVLYSNTETHTTYLRIRPQTSDKPKDYRIVTTTLTRKWTPGEMFITEHGTPTTDNSNN